ncbi:hypothetical protein BpHYR1_024149 [Brachionus plicatilis]|uniref:Uncharacterized protein n=1 Tax=Brachionus plicatilis TaxID=10195 RepID=A0A3M7R964_BRAPC|nr:hypothetical protein BpHYR1_024149 [Brachionus plicatilis]
MLGNELIGAQSAHTLIHTLRAARDQTERFALGLVADAPHCFVQMKRPDVQLLYVVHGADPHRSATNQNQTLRIKLRAKLTHIVDLLQLLVGRRDYGRPVRARENIFRLVGRELFQNGRLRAQHDLSTLAQANPIAAPYHITYDRAVAKRAEQVGYVVQIVDEYRSGYDVTLYIFVQYLIQAGQSQQTDRKVAPQTHSAQVEIFLLLAQVQTRHLIVQTRRAN